MWGRVLIAVTQRHLTATVVYVLHFLVNLYRLALIHVSLVTLLKLKWERAWVHMLQNYIGYKSYSHVVAYRVQCSNIKKLNVMTHVFAPSFFLFSYLFETNFHTFIVILSLLFTTFTILTPQDKEDT